MTRRATAILLAALAGASLTGGAQAFADEVTTPGVPAEPTPAPPGAEPVPTPSGDGVEVAPPAVAVPADPRYTG